MLVTDLSMRVDPIYGEITRRWLDHPEELTEAFAKAWYKLLHRDMGPITRYLGPWVAEPQLWQDPVPAVEGELIDERTSRRSRPRSSTPVCRCPSWSRRRGRRRRASAAPTCVAVPTARGFALRRRRTGRSTSPPSWPTCCRRWRGSSQDFNGSASGGKKVSLADLIVLGGSAAIEKAAKDGGVAITVPFAPGRTDASQEQTDVESFEVLEPRADGFRNYVRAGEKAPVERLLVEKAYFLNLTAPELTVLVGGLRALGATAADQTRCVHRSSRAR